MKHRVDKPYSCQVHTLLPIKTNPIYLHSSLELNHKTTKFSISFLVDHYTSRCVCTVAVDLLNILF